MRKGRQYWMAVLLLMGLIFSSPSRARSVEPGRAKARRASQGHGEEAWLQWGGPGRDFVVETSGLSESWPQGGPPVLWQRRLGEGHSSIVVDGDRLYTLYRPRPEGMGRGEWADEEVVVALDAASGETVWEHRYRSEPLNFRFGAGPHSTPLVVGERLFTTGTNKQLYALDMRTGGVLWSHDLVAEYGAPPTLIRPAVKAGYACSPLAWGDLIIVTAGGPGQSVMAFRQDDGSLAWKGGDFLIAPASPILIDVDGQEQLVVFGGQSVNGLDPGSGEVLWSHPHDTDGDMNNSTPVWGPDNLLFVSSNYNNGSRMLRLERGDGGGSDPTGTATETEVEELWFSRRLRIMFGNAIRIGDFVVGSSGDFGPAFLTALDVASGELLWQERRFGRASFLHLVDPGERATQAARSARAETGRLLVLDEDGALALAEASREGLEIISRDQVLEGVSWTVPTLVGTTLYARNRGTIVALDLGG